MPGAREIIARARLAGLPIALATSGMRIHVDVSLGETGLAGLFDSETTGDEVTRGKPAPDLFLLAADRLGIDPADAVVLEDSPLGIEAAVAAGMRAIAVLGHPGREVVFPAAPEVVVDDLGQAADWLGLPALDRPSVPGRSDVSGPSQVRFSNTSLSTLSAMLDDAHMAVRVFIQSGRLLPGPPQPGDLPAERIFVHASEVPEFWVETESEAVPAIGRVVSFALSRPLDIGFERIVGTVERKLNKSSR